MTGALEPYAIALGKFDALHLGHRALLTATAAYAQPLLISFSGMAKVLGWEQRAPLIAAQHRQEILAAWSVEELIIPFAEVRSLDASAFIEYLRQRWQIVAILSGEDFRFAHKRSGNVAALRRLGDEYDFVVETVAAETIEYDHESHVISSSSVRSAVDAGEMDTCRRLLGRPYRLCGQVHRGQQRGRTIGFPTANLALIGNHIPAPGVYAAHVSMTSESRISGTPEAPVISAQRATAPHLAAVNIGYLPTIGDQRPLSVEAHILDWEGDCYDQQICVDFYQRIRGEQTFADLNALQQQIANDVTAVRYIFGATASAQ